MTTPGRLRVAVGLHSPQLGGSQLSTIDLALELRRRGHAVDVFVVDADVEVSVLPVARARGLEVTVLRAGTSLLDQARTIRDVVDRTGADVLHVYHEAHWLGPLAALATRSSRCVPVVTNWMMEDTRWLPRHAPLVVGFEALRAEVAPRQRGPVRLVEPPVDLARDVVDADAAQAFRSAVGAGESDVLLSVVSRVDAAMKLDGIVRAVRAVTTLADDRVRLAVVGDGDAMATVRAEARRANEALGRRAVVLTGALDDPRPAYGAADVVLAMGGSALRGLAFGRPVVVLGTGDFARRVTPRTLPYFLRNGWFGHTPPGEGSGALVDALAPLVGSPALRAELGAHGRDVVRQRYALDIVADALEAVYHEAVATPPSRLQRWHDAAYVLGYDLAHRRMPRGLRVAVRRRLAMSGAAA